MERRHKAYGGHTSRLKRSWQKFWHFFWHEDTLLSWIVNVLVAFILIKWIVYPGLGLILGTSFPIVAVVSNSMEHDSMRFDRWWDANHAWYDENSITQEQFNDFDFRNGFNKGDIMVLYGSTEIMVGDIIVFRSGKKEPIIHRVIKTWDSGGEVHYQTKGDKNSGSLEIYKNHQGAFVSKDSLGAIAYIDETDIAHKDVVGKAVFRIPYAGYIKIWFMDILSFFGIVEG